MFKTSHTRTYKVFGDRVTVVRSLEVSGDLWRSFTVGKTIIICSLEVSGDRGFSDRRLSLVIVGASVTGP
jgi:hypothetical protein